MNEINNKLSELITSLELAIAQQEKELTELSFSIKTKKAQLKKLKALNENIKA